MMRFGLFVCGTFVMPWLLAGQSGAAMAIEFITIVRSKWIGLRCLLEAIP